MALSSKYRKILRKKGLELRPIGDGYFIDKPKGAPGNYIPQMRDNPNREDDCPSVRFHEENGQYSVSVWDWVPGPGPGDFSKDFESEEEAVEYVLYYFFKPNPHIKARKEHELISRDAVNLKEVKEIMAALLSQLEETFGDGDIPVWRFPYIMIPLEKIRVQQWEGETPIVEAKATHLPYGVWMLRRALREGKQFDAKAISDLADLLKELAIQMQEKEG